MFKWGCFWHQIAFCQDTEHRKLGLYVASERAKPYGLICKSLYMAILNVGHVSALFEPIAPDAQRYSHENHGRSAGASGRSLTTSGSVHCPNIESTREGSHLFSFARMETANGSVARTCAPLALMRPTPASKTDAQSHADGPCTSALWQRPAVLCGHHTRRLWLGCLTPSSKKTQAMTPR